ncbi:MAG: hypothetical protein QW041_00485 [Candidatus Pacearchaeota archaeon]
MQEKRIEEENEEQKKLKTKKLEKQIIILFVVLGIVFLSFLAIYDIFKPKPYFTFSGFTVYKATIKGSNTVFYLIPISGGGGEGQVMLRNDPRKLNVSIEVNELFSGIKKVWITVNSELSSDAILAANDLGMFTSRIGLNTDFALTNSTTDYPEITCENATKEIRVFLLDIGNETKVYEQENCIIVQGRNYEELIKAADALIMKWLIRIRI